jgi:hypothetical protein
VSDDDFVPVTVASSEGEAAVICGFLASQGIEATYDTGGASQPFSVGGLGGAHLGTQTILVREKDAEAARAALDARPN